MPRRLALSLEDGRYLISLARRSIETFMEKQEIMPVPSDVPPHLMERAGVFVTLEKPVREKLELRGCIGFPDPIKPLAQATIEAAVESAFNDPRFAPVSREELSDLYIEVSVLSPRKLIKVERPEDYPKHIKVGEDGLVVEKGFFAGLLLPQVAVEYGWDAVEFLNNTCLKAGLNPFEWLRGGVAVYKFSAVVFAEKKPGGEVFMKLGKSELEL